jgi:hypothetical protein
MPEPKKTPSPRPFEAQVDSALDGMRLVRQPKQSSDEAAGHRQLPPAPDEPDLVSKLIKYIKTI